jgi:hypothetical protein
MRAGVSVMAGGTGPYAAFAPGPATRNVSRINSHHGQADERLMSDWPPEAFPTQLKPCHARTSPRIFGGV